MVFGNIIPSVATGEQSCGPVREIPSANTAWLVPLASLKKRNNLSVFIQTPKLLYFRRLPRIRRIQMIVGKLLLFSGIHSHEIDLLVWIVLQILYAVSGISRIDKQLISGFGRAVPVHIGLAQRRGIGIPVFRIIAKNHLMIVIIPVHIAIHTVADK